MSNIAASAHEQAKDLRQVDGEVNQVDRATQQNAAMAEATTAAARSLVKQTRDLSRLIGRFEIAWTAQSVLREAPRRPPFAIRAKAAG